MAAKYDWTPVELTRLRHAWLARPSEQAVSDFDRAFAETIGAGPRTVSRARSKLGLKARQGWPTS